MSKKIEFQFENQEYCLEYNRDSIKAMELQGFNYQEFYNKPALMTDMLFEGAFIKNHRNIKRTKIQDIYDNLQNKTELISVLIDMVKESYEELFGEEEGKDDSKNTEWKIV